MATSIDWESTGEDTWRPEWLRGEELHAFLNWLVVWAFLANAGFMVMWFIGAPPRGPEIVAAGCIGLIVRNRPFWVQFAAFVATLVYSVLGFVAGLFNLAIASLLHSIQFFGEINPSNSIEYIGTGSALLATVGAAFFILRAKNTAFTKVPLVLGAVASIIVLAATDRAMGQGMRGHYKRMAPAGAYFESASKKSGIFRQAVAEGRHVVVIMVESLGQPVGNPEMSRKLFALYKQPRITDLYDLEQGTSLYYNSTTAGEVRELCGRWGDYYDLLDRNDDNCAPAKLARDGYDTEALHSFDGAFFKRSTWYPHIGFQSQEFARELMDEGARECGGVFPGACDRDIPAMIGERLKAADSPQFIYWLTVNSHLPVPPGMNLNVEHCEKVSPTLARDFPMICRQFAIWDGIDEALISEITEADFPDADILIVGDHMPPYFDRHHRSQFDPGHVPWLYLHRKRPQEG